ncbi:aldose 1-epimerase [Streptomyces sp. ISL-100]|uniref:aldose 1-epimerase n=1 Tax=Streptomyces sp. ISL-100 TaxID=2819173 RepID=UPI001BE76876|nr:aldose 1-epimerase [Streptomyces sp. ISL-100]MBT2395377.1 aldose 1-epimerase [Streptomyces sp. ISL-100]
MGIQVVHHRGWEIVRLTSEALSADVVPGKGGDVLSLTWVPGGVDVLWRSPWGLRHRGALATSGDSVVHLMEGYHGGWQSVFPNGGDAQEVHGVEWGMHGEVWLAPFDWEPDGESAIALRTRLVRSPFAVEKRIALAHDTLTVTETVTNEGGEPVEVMWSQHPAFGAPLISPDAHIETSARTFVVDDERDTATTDLLPGGIAVWPHAPGRDGGTVDLGAVPGPASGIDRMGYLSDFDLGFVAVTNPRLGLAAELRWDATVFPHAWYWLEAGATRGFPWFKSVYVLAIEPATSYPAQGLAKARAKTGTTLTIGPGESRTATVSLTVKDCA